MGTVTYVNVHIHRGGLVTTIKEVAERAGVSRMTVSRVINKSGYVKKEVSERVLQIIKELDYRPNLLAKGLVTRKTRIIAHIMVDIENLFHPKVIKGVEQSCYENKYSVIICDANTKFKEHLYINNLIDRYADGIIFHHLNINSKLLQQLQKENIKSVLIDNENLLTDFSNIVTDNIYGGYLAGKHLLELGHCKIGVIHGALKSTDKRSEKEYEETFQYSLWNQRLAGFKKALREFGLGDTKYMFQGEGTTTNSIKSGYVAMKKILRIDGEIPTAIYAQNDHMAIGALNAAIEEGVKVPDDISIIGHDGLDIDDLLNPKLTTIEQPRFEIGYSAAKLLIELIENKTENKTIKLRPKIVIRQTTKEIN